MLWLILILIVVFLWAIINIYDKHIVTDELRDPFLCTTIFGVVSIILFSIITLITKQNIRLPFNVILATFIAGIVLGMAIFFYYKALKYEEVSRVMPMLELAPLFAIILATIFLNEIFTLSKYIGMALLIGGGALISIKKHKRKGKNKLYLTPVIATIVLAALAFATRSILIRYSTFYASSLQLIFWIAAGEFLVALVLLTFHHPHIIRKSQVKGIKHLIIISILSAGTFLIYIWAVKIAPAISFIVVFGAVQSLFVFIMATILSKSKKIVREPLEKGILIQKIMAIILIMIGVILVVT